MNALVIVGNLVRDPVLRTTPNGHTVCDFMVAVNRIRKREGQPEADYFKVTTWGAQAENCARYLAKGRKVAVSGMVSARPYMDNNGQARASLEVQAQEVQFLSPRSTGAGEFTPVDDPELPYA